MVLRSKIKVRSGGTWILNKSQRWWYLDLKSKSVMMVLGSEIKVEVVVLGSEIKVRDDGTRI